MKDCRRTLLDEFVKLSKDWDNNNMLYKLFIKNPIIRINTVFFKEIAIKNRSFYHEFTTFERALI